MATTAITKISAQSLRTLVCFSLSVHLAYAAASDQDIDIKKTELSSVTGHIELLQKTLNEDQSRQTDLQQELRNDEVKIGQMNQQMRAVNQQLATAELELQKIKKVQQISVAQLTKQQNSLSQQIRIIYQLGRTPTLKAVLNPQDINTTNRHIVYYHYLNQAHIALMSDVKQAVDTLNKNMSVIAERESSLNHMLLQKQQQQQQLQAARSKRQNVIAELNNHSKDKQQELSTLTANQRTLQTMLSSLQNESISAATNQSFKNLRGKLQWPLKGTISTPFGAHDENNQRTSGVVINAPEGTSVRSIHGGKVIFANWLRGFGLLVIINHGDGYMSLYARNQALYASVGDTVQPGDVIASIGNTGGFAKTSLYFEIRHNGAPVDPHFWCG
jgi:septal ring factor EnvC (AmiA/AmiB activator)